MKPEDFETKRALDSAHREQLALSQELRDHIVTNTRISRALLAVFLEARQEQQGGKK